jgi:hypothetical protein
MNRDSIKRPTQINRHRSFATEKVGEMIMGRRLSQRLTYTVSTFMMCATAAAFLLIRPTRQPMSDLDGPFFWGSPHCTAQGWHVNGTRPYWKYFRWPRRPSLYDIFVADGNLVVILSFRFCYIANGYESGGKMAVGQRYAKAHWLMRRADGTVVNSTFTKNDPELHSKVLIFPYPGPSNPNDVVTIFTNATDGEVIYADVPFCHLPPRVQRFGTVCTQNLVTTRATVLPWVAWHRAQGFDNVVLYINEVNGAARMRSLLEGAVANNSLTIVDWGWPAAYPFHDQPLTQASCLWRAKGRYKWIGMNDLDEIFVPAEGKTVGGILAGYEAIANTIGGVACCNRWFAGGGIVNLYRCARECDRPPHRQKMIVRTDNVDYFCNHRIMLGLPEHKPQYMELVNGHFSAVRGPAQMVPCNHVTLFTTEVERWKAALSG